MKVITFKSWGKISFKSAEALILQCLHLLSQSLPVSHIVVGVVLSAYCIQVNMLIKIVWKNGSAYVKLINIYLITCLVWYAFYKPLSTYLNLCLDPADLYGAFEIF